MMALHTNKAIFVFIASCCLAQHAASQAAPQQPRIVTTDGHLVFQTGANHNISFKSSPGGSVNIDGTNVKQMSEKVTEHQSKLATLEGIPDLVAGNKAEFDAYKDTVDDRIGDVNAGLRNTTRQITLMGRSLNSTRIYNRLKYRVRRLQTNLNTVTRKLRDDNCASGPCHNGGTCVDMYETFRCLCPINWQGTTCNEDVDECSIYQGTAQGCHSGATCVNTNGGFSCNCPTGYTGVLCIVRSGTCSVGSSSELCGHGSCVDSGSTHRCICDDGWDRDTATPPRCTVDIDECQQVDKPCHDNVQCINVPGAYFCGICPAGSTGNGHQCNDINECLIGNGGCSINPRVDCINNLGSRTCGPCPLGYHKTPSEACIWVGICSNDNNGGCSHHASCTEIPSLGTRSCRCNSGYTGVGEGPTGCSPINGTQPSTDPCSPNPCMHGNCFSQDNSNAFTCSCLQGWTGYQCQLDIDECADSICQNGGTCNNTQGNYTCTCTQFSTGRNCETPTYACGGELTGATGSFQFPPANHDAYPHDISCAWRITTTLNKILSLTFTRFQLESHTNCDYDFLQIHDGSTASAHKIGKYCGNDTIQGLQGRTINTTHNMIYFWFKADRSVNDRGFSFDWISVTPECGSDIRGETSGVIGSPGYPGNYPINRTCVWTIRVPPGNNIKLVFARIDLEHHSNCSYDYLEIRNGLLDSDRLMNRFCSNSNPPGTLVETEGNEIYIKFHSDQSSTGLGFQFTWNADPTPVGLGCGGNLNLTDGILISPNFPNHYDHSGDCVWVITVPNSNAKIALNFTDFQMESSSSCAFDYLEIRDGLDETAATFGKFCGNQIPALITSTTHNLYLRFHSDSSVNGQGFRATWTVACGGTFTDQTGTLLSPYWPGRYPHQKVCNYGLSAREDQVIEVTFSHFGVEASVNDDDCRFDSLLAYDGSTAASTVLRRMCGTALPIPLISTGSNMLLVFTSDGSVTDLGFRATYEFRNTSTPIDPLSCGGILTNASGTVISPGHPNLYPHGTECLWEIRVPEGFQIRFTFNFFSIESTTTCAYDYVQISNNRTTDSTQSLPPKGEGRVPGKVLPTIESKNQSSSTEAERYCGSSKPPTFTSTQNVLFLKFKADASIAHEGFSATYISFNHSWCGDERRTLPGAITSPDYPSNYPHQRECIWTIVAPDNHQIAVNITDLAMEEHINCRYDYVEIRNGGNQLSPLIGRFCGSTIETPNFVSQSNRLWIKFKSDVSDSARGFRIWYEDAGEGCGADLTGPSGMFLSPNYPNSYSRSAECYWTITVAQGSSVMLIMVAMDIERHPQCNYDYVEAIEGLHSGPTISKVCGNVPPQPIQSRGNIMTVKFRSDTSLGGGGFHAAYHADCQNQVLNASSGVIESPNFPDSYPHNRNCSWIINSHLGNIISYSFSHFDIESDIAGTACRNDVLEIRDGNTPSSNLIHLYCGSDLPTPFNSTSNALYIRFKSDASLAHNGFRLEYVTIGCGGDFNSLTGAFTSPNYPGRYPANRECVWRITVPVGNQIKLELKNVHLEFQANCTFDYLEVLGGPDANSPILSKICQTRNESYIVTSSGNQMYVKFRTDQSTSGTGFTANYTSIPGSGCGGVYTTPTGGLQSPGSPGNYPHNTNCEWNITVASFQTVQLTFKDFDLEAHDTCIYDYVVMYDGLEANAPEIGRVCGTNLTDHTYTSSGRSMRVRMRTDSSSNGRGFTATYITSCGGRTIVGDDIGIIRSPNFPANYDPNHNCTWTLMGSLAVDRITLQFTHMDLEESDSSLGVCAHDSVRVLQGDNTGAPQQGIYCGTGVPASITSTSYALTIVFSSDASLQQTGFSASYSKSTSFCGGNITATHGAFSTPGYPDAYPRSAECIWILNAAPGNQIQLSFSSFDLEDTSGCARDYVEVRDGANLNSVLGRYCGNTLPSNLTIAKSLHVKFRSDDSNNFAGFTAQFSTLTGGDLVGNTGQVASPLYPRPYPHNSDNRWTIIVDIGKKVRIEFNDLDIEVGSSCSFDYIQFLDGAFDTGPAELLKVCGTTAPQPFSSNGNVMTVVFHTDTSATGRGFLISWTAVDQVITTPGTTVSPPTQPAGCNFNLVATEAAQNITSPNWPENYENRMSCTWTIRSTDGSRIQFIMQSMDIESSSNCVYDALKIYNGVSEISSNILDTKCGRSNLTQAPVISTAGVMKLKFTSDSSVIGHGFLGIFKKACGGVLTGTSGVITSPSHPNTYPTNSTCQWLITVAAGRTIELTVNSFSLPGSNNCTGDRLRILNGNNADSPHIEGDKWSYCGSQLPTLNSPYASGSRYMWVEFISDSLADPGTTRNFELSYIEKSVTCGGDLVIPDDGDFVGSFTSPDFGTNDEYPHNADCAWVITGPANVRIQLDFPTFHLEKHSTCNYDYVLIRDGGTENSPQLAKICGSENQPTVKSSSNVIRVRLVTDGSVGKGGFNITYKKETCGGTLIGAAGAIQSPQFPNDYPNNANCEWYIEAPVGHYIGINFTTFTLGTTITTDCTGQDSLSVYNRDRFGNLTTQVGSYCGRRAPVDVRTADSKAYIRFTSNAASNFAGFSLSFFASVESCGGQLTTPTGVITSPNYPGYYAHSRDCSWFITAPAGKRVTVTFVDFEIERQPNCLFDYVEITNGHLERSPTIGRYCGNSSAVGTVVESTGSKMLIHFNSDGSVSNGGFRLTYSTSEDIVCGGVISPTLGAVEQLLTPGYNETVLENGTIVLSGQYPNRMQCEWMVQGDTATNSSVVLKFQPNRFKLEHDGECRYDFLVIREGVNADGAAVGRFCSNLTNNVPTQIAIPGNQLWLAFVSDGSIQHEGFNITVQLAPCGGVLRGDSGTIVSPNYPGQYDNDMGCAWEIIADEGQQIELTINRLDIEHTPKCTYDYVALYNGGSHLSPVMAKLCENITTAISYTTATNKMRIEFVSDFSQSGNGFHFTYRTKSQGCGGVFNAITGNISTQNYPSDYPSNVECVWDIMVPDGYHVKLQADGTFDIESGDADTSSCFYDYVQFFNVDADGVATELDRRYCGHTAPPLQESDGNHMRVKFRSDQWTTGGGFNFLWTAGCGGTFNADSGVIFSPGFPNNYGRNLVCDYTITAGPSQYVVLQFDEESFRLESGSSCQYDSVSIFEGNVNGTSKGAFCGLTAPQPIATRGTMVVRFKTDNDTADDGFKANFVKSDCGGYLNGSSGELKSPTHPVDYHNNLNCTWQIEVSSNRAVNLRFEEFELEASTNGNCRFDYLAVYDGLVVNASTLIGRYCGSQLPENVRSSSNTLTAVFKTDASVTKGGFRAIYTEAYGSAQGCGGRRNDTSGSITPISDGDGGYESNLDCVWIIIAPDDKVFSIQINSINIESGDGCPYDGLELNDGFSSQDPKIMPAICGNPSNIQRTSATNIIRVRFYSDSSVSNSGFNLTYTAVNPTCGGVRILTDTSGSLNISSPGYPNAPNDIPANCRWTIGAPVGKQIRVTVTDMLISGDSSCDVNFLQLRDQPFITNNGQGQNIQFCNTTTPYEFDSYGNEMQINFKYTNPAGSSPYRGFALNYAIASCNRTFTGLDGRITTPGWPSSYPHNMNCFIRVNIPGPTQYKIAVYFSQFSVEAHSSCNYDYVEIFDGLTSLGKRCGNSIPDPIISTGNSVTFQVVSDASVGLGGFDLTYVASPSGCGGTLTAPRGTFNGPTPGVSSNCVWVIDLPSRLRPTIQFTVMDLRRNNTACPGAYVEVRNGGNADAPLMGKFCDGAVPPLTSNSNKLYIKFVASVTLHSEAKFTAKYTSGEQPVTRVTESRFVIDK